MSDLDRHYRSQRALELLTKGFRSPIVVIETNLSSSTVREMAKILSGGKRASSGPLPSPNYFIASVTALSEASLFASIYRSVGGVGITESIDTNALIKSHDLYLEMRALYFVQEKDPLDINKCWVIARDLRSNMAWLHKCVEDNSYYLLVEGQRLPSCCPWCSDKKTSRGGKSCSSPQNDTDTEKAELSENGPVQANS